jgi:hypothetical protein
MTGDIAYVILLILKEVMCVRTNIKLSPWLPIIMVLITSLFLFFQFNVLDVIMILGTVFITFYYVMAMVKRKDALVIEGTTLKVTSPIKTKEYDVNDLTSISLVDHDTLLRGIYQGQEVKLITNIYDQSLSEIKDYLVRTYPHIIDKTT